MSSTLKQSFRVYAVDLSGVMLVLGRIAGYEVDREDMEAIRYGLTATSEEKDIWFDYPLSGTSTIQLRLCREEENTDNIYLELEYPGELHAQIDLCEFFVQEFYMQLRNRDRDLFDWSLLEY